MHICLTIASLSKKGGGPATVVQHLSEQLVSSGVSVSVVTAEADSGQSEALPRDERINVVRLPANGRSGWRSAFVGRLHKTLEHRLGSKDDTAVHDFGLWLPANHAVASGCRKLGVPLVCSPCGMLAPWALRHKAWKKRLAWWMYQRRDLSRATVLVATAGQEKQDIRQRMLGKPIALVPNGVALPEDGGLRSKVRGGMIVDGRKTAVFLGRIHPVKGLKNLVEAWHLVRPEGWRCILAGPDEAGHQRELEAILRLRKLENAFEFPGMMEDERKWTLLREADLFVLPSFTENFGIAVAEALAAGVPVITTKGTPWKDLVDHGCGWWIDVGIETLATALHEALSLSDEQRREMGLRGRTLVEEKYSWSKIGTDMKAVYDWVLGDGLKPACVT